MHEGLPKLECNQGLEYLYICELRLRGVGGAQQEETGGQGEDRGERESPSGVSGP